MMLATQIASGGRICQRRRSLEFKTHIFTLDPWLYAAETGYKTKKQFISELPLCSPREYSKACVSMSYKVYQPIYQRKEKNVKKAYFFRLLGVLNTTNSHDFQIKVRIH